MGVCRGYLEHGKVTNSAFVVTVDRNGQAHDVWQLGANEAVRVGVPNARQVKNAHVTAASKKGLKATLTSHQNAVLGHLAPWRVVEMNLEPGSYYARMARPIPMPSGNSGVTCPGAHNYPNEIAGIAGQLDYLTDRLSSVLQVVHPTEATLGVYGHDIRNLLIIAATEVEAGWRAVLAGNGHKKDRFQTADYIKVAAPLRLREYAVDLVPCPWLKPRQPFRGWSAARPTQSLKWFDAYNAVKHDRENSFERAQLGYAIDAVAACFVMAWAQFGHSAFRGKVRNGSFFRLAMPPKWKPAELYTPRHDHDASTQGYSTILNEVCYPF